MLRDESTRYYRHRLAVERWKAKNRDYYLAQKRRLAAQPSYLQHRRAMYHKKKKRSATEKEDLSTMVNSNVWITQGREEPDPREHRRGEGTPCPSGRHRARPPEWAAAQGPRGPGGEAHGGGNALLPGDRADPAGTIRLGADPREAGPELDYLIA